MKSTYMKYFAKFAFAAVIAMAAVSCEDDDPLTAGDGDPLNENVVSVEATVSTTQMTIGEGNVTPFTVSLGTSFNSDATVTVRALLDNGNVATGTAVVPAGSTSGMGTVTMPADDSRIPEGLVSENAGTLTATAILLDELVEGTAYVLNSNTVDLNVYSDTLGVAGGLNYIMDWTNPAEVDLDLYVIDANTTTLADAYESAESGSRFESDLFQSAGRPDGTYFWLIGVFTFVPGESVDYQILATRPDGTLAAITATATPDELAAGFIVAGQFDKVTDPVTGAVSYTNIMPF